MIQQYIQRKRQLNSRDLAQDDLEFAWLCRLIEQREVKTYLEIGSRHGGSMFMTARFMQPNSKVVCVDLPGANWGRRDSGRRLDELSDLVREEGHQVDLLYADSHHRKTVKAVEELLNGRPVDCLMLDADHRYEGVQRDFELYQSLVRKGGIIALHDIAPNHPSSKMGVPKLWSELFPNYNTAQCIARDDKYGIGVLYV